MGKQKKKRKKRQNQPLKEFKDLAVKEIPEEVLKEYNVFTLGEMAWKCYQQHGRGISAYGENMPFYYFQSYKTLSSEELAVLRSYNPENMFLAAYPISFEDDHWQTQIIPYFHKAANCRVLISKQIPIELYVANCVL